MERSLGRLLGSAAGSLALLAAAPAAAVDVSIGYELVPLAAAGTYEYRYTVANVSLPTPFNWFSIDFDPALYDESSLLVTSTGRSAWSEQILASVLASPAQYDAYKTVGAPLTVGDAESGFSVRFAWLGAGTPGSQAFTVYDAATLDVLATGTTTALAAAVPEPSTLVLTLLASAVVGAACRRGAVVRNGGKRHDDRDPYALPGMAADPG